ncbi:protein-tyrosine kinase 6-like [Rhinoraja longicauda]
MEALGRRPRSIFMANAFRRLCPCLNAPCRSSRGGERDSQRPPLRQGGGERMHLAAFTALHHFTARDSGQLSFQIGDHFEILDGDGDSGKSWWFARKRGCRDGEKCKGYIPSTYMASGQSVDTEPWFVGKLSRSKAEDLLCTQAVNGAFIIRESDNLENGYALSVLGGTTVRHLHIIQNNAGQYYLNAVTQFSSLKELVEYYTMNCLRPGLQLSIPCQQQHRPNIRDLSHLTMDNWERPKSEFTLTEKLGSGHFGNVYAGYWNNTVQVAIKTLDVDFMNQRDFQMEMKAMKRLQHPHLTCLYATCTASNPFYIVTQLMEKGSLLTYLRSKEGRCLNLERLVDMTVQVSEGMAYLESQNYIHRDLAARNILVGENLTCTIADFGLARMIWDETYVSRSTTIPYKWTAPEAVEFGYFSVKSDVWSFGILLYEVVTYGKNPYPGMSNQEAVRAVSRGYRMSCPDGCPTPLHQVMLNCWETTASCRPPFATLVKTLSGLHTEHLY